MEAIKVPDPLTKEDLQFLEQLHQKSAHGQLSEGEQPMYSLLTKVHDHAFRDELTGLYNRKVFNIEASKRYQRSSENNRSAVFVIDINDFKHFNSLYGHDGGDKVIQHIASLIGETVREHDIAIRYAGDEFCVIATQLSENGAAIVAKRLYDRVAQSTVPIGGKSVTVAISVGYAEITSGVRNAFTRADRALLYGAKAKKGLGPTIASDRELV